MNKNISLLSFCIFQFWSILAFCQNDIRLHLGIDSNEYHNGPIFYYSDSSLIFSDLQSKKFYDVKWLDNTQITQEIKLFDIKGIPWNNDGYLFQMNNKYYLLNENYLYNFSIQGSYISKIKIQETSSGISYFPNFRIPGFKVIQLDSNRILFPISFVHSFDIKKVLSKYKIARTIKLLNLKDGKSTLFGKYDSIFSQIYIPKNRSIRIHLNNSKLYTLRYFESTLDVWEFENLYPKKVNEIRLENNPKLPPNLITAKYIEIDAYKLNSQQIESSNLNDFIITDKGIILIEARPETDSTIYEEAKEKPKGVCYLTSQQEKNQWVQYYHKPIFYKAFHLNGKFIEEKILEVLNESEVIFSNKLYFLLYSSLSIKGGSDIIKFPYY